MQAEHIQSIPKPAMRFLTPDQIAEMLGIGRKTVIDRVAKEPGFPNPVNGWRKPVWLEDEVRKFFKRKSAQNANKAH